MLTQTELETLKQMLTQDPHPAYKKDAGRIYGMKYYGYNVKFTVSDGIIKVIDVEK